MSERIEYFDFLRGLAIIMVVAIHTFGSSYTYESISLLGISVRQLMNCAVPIFCVSSAFFLGNKNFVNKHEYFIFLRKQILRVYLPCLICSLPYLLLNFRKEEFIKPVLKFFSCGYSVYYFIALIIQFYVLLPLLKKFSIFRNIPLMAFISVAWVFLYTYLVKYYMHLSLPLLLYGGPIFCFIVYFAIGLRYSQRKSFGSVKLWGALLAVFFVLSVFESYFLMTDSLSGSGLKSSSVLFSIAAVILLYSTTIREQLNLKKWIFPFAFLGRYSFGIYLTHLYFLTIFSKLLPATFLANIPKELYWGGVTMIVLLADLLFLVVIKNALPKISKWGLGV